ncbi:MAG: hypothetical protein ACI9J4_000182 [Paraglaciecola sp.]|jgi:hypothetical protein
MILPDRKYLDKLWHIYRHIRICNANSLNEYLNDTVPNSQPKNTLTQQLKIQAMESSDNYLSVEKVEPVDTYDRIRFKKHRTNKKTDNRE